MNLAVDSRHRPRPVFWVEVGKPDVTPRRPDLILIDLKMPVLSGQHNEAEKLAAIAIDQLKEIVAFD
jgi:CheY-like chemotaxis protein